MMSRDNELQEQISMLDLIEDDDSENDKAEKIEKEKDKLLNNISAGVTNTVRDKVAWILNNYPDTRNSDITLMLKFWEEFHPQLYDGGLIAPSDLYELTKLTSITRERAKIQNQYVLFLGDEEVRRKRGQLSEEYKEKAIKDKPIEHQYIIYMDESGKNDDYLIVGSLWYLDIQGSWWLPFVKKIEKFRTDNDFNREFHFADMSRNDLPIYKEFINLFLEEVPTYSFKLIGVPTDGISDKLDAFKELFYYLVVKGINFEIEKGRALLPRSLTIWKDEEQEGSDQLLVAYLEDSLLNASESRYDGELYINRVTCVDSEKNINIQIADLFTGSANRILNKPSPVRNHKDEFAEYFLDLIGVKLPFEMNTSVGDLTVHLSLI